HFQISHVDKSYNYDVRVGAGNSGVASFFGLVAMGAFLGAIGLHLSKSGGGANAPGTGGTTSAWDGLPELSTLLRRISKSKTDIWIGGVCGGLGEHTPLPAWVWRALFLFFLFCYGVGLPLYICLWICLPDPSGSNQPSMNPPRTT